MPLLSIGCFVVSYLICFFLIPLIIRKAHEKNWVDQPNQRKVHTQAIPTMGGMAIIAAVLITSLFLGFYQGFDFSLIAVSIGIIVLTVTGIIDDLNDISAKKRLIVQASVASLMVTAGFGFNSFLGIIGLPIWVLSVLSVITIVGFINAFNFIDGIDGLAGGIGFISCMVLSFLFGSTIYGYICLAIAGGLFAFLYFNFNPAKIFMGDTGSTVIGFLVVVFALKVTTLPYLNIDANPHIVGMSILMLPTFDIIRTIFFRMLKRKSPFSADKTHIHHLLIKTGNNHKIASVILYSIHLVLISLAAFVGFAYSPLWALLGLFCLCVFSTEILGFYKFFKLKTNIKQQEFKGTEVAYDNVFLSKKI